MKTGMFIGVAGLDCVYEQSVLPSENEKSKTYKYNTCIGGPAANAAITYTLLGGKAILVSCIGNSILGLEIKSKLKEHGIKVIDAIESSTMLPMLASISINPETGSRTVWSGQNKLDKEIEIDIDEELKEADFCLFDCNQPEVSLPILKKAYMLNKEIVLDAGSWKETSIEFLQKASTAIASFNCIPPKELGSFFDIARKSEVKKIAITNGEKQIKWEEGSRGGGITPPVVKAVDTLGAGDVFHGAYCHFAFNKNQLFENALKSASIVAANKCKHYGISKTSIIEEPS
ncbi:MAG: PfkB family carbohydrate kinase [Oscillospiraceae bacterium]|nr:PfkB family carbohydrate kinase [Oscillospiraceae bacterium]